MLTRPALALVLLLGWVGNASAQPSAPSEYLVTLRNGAIFRGEVLEFEPGRQVTIRTVRGEVRSFPWRDVASAGPMGKTQASPAVAPTAPRTGPSQAAPPAVLRQQPVPPVAAAQQPAPIDATYDRHIQAANRHYQEDEHEAALRELTAAYQLHPRPAVLYLMARSYQALRRYDEAIILYRRYMREEPDLSAERREGIGTVIASLSMTQPVPSVAPTRRDQDAARAQSPRPKDSLDERLPPPPPVVPSSLASDSGRVVQLKLKSTVENIRLEFLKRRGEVEAGWGWPGDDSGTLDTWRRMCDFPCDVPVARGATYRVSGEDIVRSEEFTLPARGSHFVLHVSPGSRSRRVGAWVNLGLGTVFAAGGAVGLYFGLRGRDIDWTTTNLGGIAFGIGVGSWISSIVLFATSRTRIEIARPEVGSQRAENAPSGQFD